MKQFYQVIIEWLIYEDDDVTMLKKKRIYFRLWTIFAFLFSHFHIFFFILYFIMFKKKFIDLTYYAFRNIYNKIKMIYLNEKYKNVFKYV